MMFRKYKSPIAKYYQLSQALIPFKQKYESLYRMPKDFMIIGIDHRTFGNDVISAIWSEGYMSDRTAYLYLLPFENSEGWICRMLLKHKNQQCVEILDFTSRLENSGAGTVLMRNVISFYKLAGFSFLVGDISPAHMQTMLTRENCGIFMGNLDSR